MTDTTADACTAHIVNEHSGGTHRCALEAGHHCPEFGADHAGPVDDNGVRYRWSDDAIGAVPHAASVVVPAADRAALRDRIAAAIWARYPDAEPSRAGLVMANPHTLADAVLSVLPAPADRSAVLREAADRIDATREPFPIAVQNGITWATAELCRMAVESAAVDRVAAETPPAETDPTLLDELQRHLAEHTPSCNARTDHLMRRAAWALGVPKPAHVGGNAEDCPGCEGTNPPYPFLCPGPAVEAQPGKDTETRKADPDCEHCDGSGLDPDAYFVNHDTGTWTHTPCSECLPEDDDAAQQPKEA